MSASYKGQGRECYDWYHYLWHLIAIRAVKAAAPAPADGKYAIEPDAWSKLNLDVGVLPGEGEVIALIDTGVNDKHPNLAGRILPAVDFASHPYGMVFADRAAPGPLTVPAAPPPPPDSPAVTPDPLSKIDKTMTRGLEAVLADSLIDDARWNAAQVLAADPLQSDVVERLRAGRGVKRSLTSASRRRYGAHGTACAGLLAGAPPAAPAPSGPQNLAGGVDPVEGVAPALCVDDPDPDTGPIPYWGVAPGAKVLPIVVSAEPTAEQLILAFLYAWDQGVSVIHFPREAPDPSRAPHYKPGYGGTRYEDGAAEQAAWTFFQRLLKVVSDHIPVVCAAGNDGVNHLIYPASEADSSNGIIAVGSVTYRGRRASYSNYDGSSGTLRVTIAAPSDDAEVYTRHQMRLDRESPGWREHDHFVHADKNGVDWVEYAPQALLTTDVPGPSGYAGGNFGALDPDVQPANDRPALYALFGGTSGASAIVAGAVALRQSQALKTAGARRTGVQIKADLVNSGALAVNWPWLAPNAALDPDAPNGEMAISQAAQFGAGVLDLDKLL